MKTIVARHKVGDIDTWLEGHQDRIDVFASSISGFQTFQDTDDPNSVVLIMNVNDPGQFGAILNDPANASLKNKHTVQEPIIVSMPVESVNGPSNSTIVDAVYHSFAKGDVPAVLGMMDPEIVWNEAEGNSWADGNPYIGPDAVAAGVFARIGEEFEYFNLVDIEIHEMHNNQVLATMRYKGKRRDNGAVIDAQAAHHWKLTNGKVVSFQQYVDTKQLAEAENL